MKNIRLVFKCSPHHLISCTLISHLFVQVSWHEFSQFANPSVLARVDGSAFLSTKVSRIWQKLVQSHSTTSAPSEASGAGVSTNKEISLRNPSVPLQACWSAILNDSELAGALGDCDRAFGQNILLNMRTARALDPPKSDIAEDLDASNISWAEFKRLQDSKELSEAKLSVLLKPMLQRLWVKLLRTDSHAVEEILATYDNLMEEVDVSAARDALAAAGGAVNRAPCWTTLEKDMDLLRLLGMGQGTKHGESILCALRKQVAQTKAKNEKVSEENSPPEHEFILWGEFANFADPVLLAAALAATTGTRLSAKIEDSDGQSTTKKNKKSLVQFKMPGSRMGRADEKKTASGNQDTSFDPPKSMPTRRTFESMFSGASPSTEPDSIEFLEAAVHDLKVLR